MKSAFVASLFIASLVCPAHAMEQNRLDRYVTDAATTFAIPETWIRAVIAVESAGDVHATSRSGAMGLMQIMPNTWAVLRDRFHLGRDPYDPQDNVMAGAALLRELYDRFGPAGFLAAYNASPERYLAYITGGKPLTDETRAYLTRIAPRLGDEELARAVLAAGMLPDWRGASLFARSLDQRPTTGSPPIPSRLEPQPGGLFAALSPGSAP